jgi:hypothetical protein
VTSVAERAAELLDELANPIATSGYKRGCDRPEACAVIDSQGIDRTIHAQIHDSES